MKFEIWFITMAALMSANVLHLNGYRIEKPSLVFSLPVKNGESGNINKHIDSTAVYLKQHLENIKIPDSKINRKASNNEKDMFSIPTQTVEKSFTSSPENGQILLRLRKILLATNLSREYLPPVQADKQEYQKILGKMLLRKYLLIVQNHSEQKQNISDSSYVSDAVPVPIPINPNSGPQIKEIISSQMRLKVTNENHDLVNTILSIPIETSTTSYSDALYKPKPPEKSKLQSIMKNPPVRVKKQDIEVSSSYPEKPSQEYLPTAKKNLLPRIPLVLEKLLPPTLPTKPFRGYLDSVRNNEQTNILEEKQPLIQAEILSEYLTTTKNNWPLRVLEREQSIPDIVIPPPLSAEPSQERKQPVEETEILPLLPVEPSQEREQSNQKIDISLLLPAESLQERKQPVDEPEIPPLLPVEPSQEQEQSNQTIDTSLLLPAESLQERKQPVDEPEIPQLLPVEPSQEREQSNQKIDISLLLPAEPLQERKQPVEEPEIAPLLPVEPSQEQEQSNQKIDISLLLPAKSFQERKQPVDEPEIPPLREKLNQEKDIPSPLPAEPSREYLPAARKHSKLRVSERKQSIPEIMIATPLPAEPLQEYSPTANNSSQTSVSDQQQSIQENNIQSLFPAEAVDNIPRPFDTLMYPVIRMDFIASSIFYQLGSLFLHENDQTLQAFQNSSMEGFKYSPPPVRWIFLFNKSYYVSLAIPKRNVLSSLLENRSISNYKF